MLTVHHLHYSQSFRIVWLLEEIGTLPYELKIYDRQPDELAPPELKILSPLGTAPVITDNDGFVLCESNAVIEFILDLSGGEAARRLRPVPGTEERTKYLFWFHASAATFQLLMSIDTLFRVVPNRLPCCLSSLFRAVFQKLDVSFTVPRLQKVLELAEKDLANQPYLSGPELTAADITIVYSFDALFLRRPDMTSSYPNCYAWYERVQNRPAFQAALKKVGDESISKQF